jgi:hypothetical protein
MSGRIALRSSANFHQPARAHQSVILDRRPVTRIYQMVCGLDRLSHKWLNVMLAGVGRPSPITRYQIFLQSMLRSYAYPSRNRVASSK